MKIFVTLLFLLPLLSAPLLANGKKAPPASISFHIEGSSQEGPKFVRKVQTIAGDRYFRKAPEISSSDIVAFSPFPSPDDKATYGIVFELSKRATQRLNVFSNMNNGKLLIAIVNGQAIGVVKIDGPVTDGKLVIWSGIQDHEIKLYDQLAPRIGEDPKTWKKRLKYEQKKEKK